MFYGGVCIGNIVSTQLNSKNNKLYCTVKTDLSTLDNVLLINPNNFDNFPEPKTRGLLFQTKDGEQMIMPVDFSRDALAKSKDELYIGVAELNNLIHFIGSKIEINNGYTTEFKINVLEKVILQAKTTNVLKNISDQLAEVVNSLDEIATGFTSLGGVTVPPQSPAPQSLLNAGDMTSTGAVIGGLVTVIENLNNTLTPLIE